MVELVEVETWRRELEREVVSKRVKSVEVPGKKEILQLPAAKKDFIAKLEGAKLAGCQRRGVAIQFKLDTGDHLLIDLSEGGWLRKSAPKDEVVKGTQVIISFTQGGQLRIVDPTNAVKLAIGTPEELAELRPDLAQMGPDPLDEPISWTRFGEALLRRRMKLKLLLLDSTVVAGVGPVYSDEILFAAGLRGDRQSESLSTQEMRRLYRSVVEIVHLAAKHRGTTLADGTFADLHGKPGEYGPELQVYERDGQACLRCRATIGRHKVAGKWSYSCPECQV